jgi:hypothetical protein
MYPREFSDYEESMKRLGKETGASYDFAGGDFGLKVQMHLWYKAPRR